MCRSPTQTGKFTTSLDFRREVIRRIKLLGRVRTQHAALSNVKLGTGEAAPAERKLAFKQRPFSLVPPRIIAIGSSTGGPQALSVYSARRRRRCPGFPSWWRNTCRRSSPASRAFGARHRTRDQGRDPGRDAQTRHDLCSAGQSSHDGRAPRQPGSPHRQRAAGSFLPPGG